MTRRSESTKEIATALAKAQKEIKNAKLDDKNPHFNSKFASLSSVYAACRDALADNGLSVVQPLQTIDGKLCLETTLLHSSGEWYSSYFELFVDKLSMQGLGSACTYARRYAYSSMIGIAQDDDDGNASTIPRHQQHNPIPQAVAKHLPLKPHGTNRVSVTELVDARFKAQEEEHTSNFVHENKSSDINDELKELGQWKFPLKGPSSGMSLAEINPINLVKIQELLNAKTNQTKVEQVTLTQINAYLSLAQKG